MKVNLFPPLGIHEKGQRPNQEDSLYPSLNEVLPTDRLFLVCDGMGGHEKGEVASQTVCETFGQWSKQNSTDTITDAQLLDVLEAAYRQLDELDNGEGKGMGTTLTLLHIGCDCITAAHIGDSRIYHIRPNDGILYQSRDHSLVFDLYRSGEITYEEMATHPQKNVITKAITTGLSNRVKPDIIHITDIQAGDYFYMCSDGMLEQMSNEELVALLSSDISDEEKRQQLIKATAGNSDNHTAWLLHIETVVGELGDKKTDEESTSLCNAVNIKPQRDFHGDMGIGQEPEIAEQDDVEIVSDTKRTTISSAKPSAIPPTHKKKKALITVGLLAVLVILFFIFFMQRTQKSAETEPDKVEVPGKPHEERETRSERTIGEEEKGNAGRRAETQTEMEGEIKKEGQDEQEYIGIGELVKKYLQN